MKKSALRILSTILALTLLVGMMPMGVFAADTDVETTSEIIYDFRWKAYSGETSSTIGNYMEFPEEGSASARQWAYIGNTATFSNSGGTFISMGADYLSVPLNGSTEGEWVAFKIKVPTAGTYQFNVNAYQYQNAANFGIYVANPTEELLAELDPSNTATYGTIAPKEEGSKVNKRTGANNKLSVFTEENLVGIQNYYAEKGSSAVGMATKSFGKYTFEKDGEYILFFRAESCSAALVATLTLVPVIEGQLAGIKKVYAFQEKAYSGEQINNMANFTDYPAAGSSSAREWAYIGTTAKTSNSGGTFAGVNASYVSWSMAEEGEWAAVKIKAPSEGIYDVSANAYRYKNGGILDVYLVPLTEELNEILTDESTYGTVTTVTGSKTKTRTGANNNLSVFTEANKIGSMNTRLSSGTAGMVQETIGRVNITESGEYVLFCRTGAGIDNVAMRALLVGDITLNGLNLHSAELTLSADSAYVGDTTVYTASAKAYRSDGSEIAESIFTAADSVKFSSSNTDVATVDENTGEIRAVGIGEAEITATVTYASHVKTATKTFTVTKNHILGSAAISLADSEVWEDSVTSVNVTALSVENDSISLDASNIALKVADASQADLVTFDGTSVTAKKAGTVSIYATVTYKDKSVDTESVTLTIKELKRELSGVTEEYKLYYKAYEGDNSSDVSGFKDYPETDNGRRWAYIGSTATGADPAVSPKGDFLQIATAAAGEYAAIKIKVAEPGLYHTSIRAYSRDRAGITSLYIAPLTDAAEADPTSVCVPAYYVDDFNFFDASAAGMKALSGNSVIIPEAGEYIVVFIAEKQGEGFKSNSWAMYPGILTLSGTKFGSVEVSLDTDSIYPKETAQASVAAYREDNTVMAVDSSLIQYVSSDPTVATVDAKTGAITAINPGTTDISVTLTIDGVTHTGTKALTVKKPIVLERVTLSAQSVMAVNATGITTVVGRGTLGETVYFNDSQVKFAVKEQSADNVITMSETGQISAKAVGTATIYATVTYGEQVLNSNEVTITVSDRAGANDSVMLHFNTSATGESAKNVDLLTDYGTLRHWKFLAHTISNTTYPVPGYSTDFTQTVVGQTGEYLAVVVKIPAAGEYAVTTRAYCRYRSLINDMYMFPYSQAAADNLTKYMTEENHFASVNMYSKDNAYLDFDAGSFYANEAGEYILVMQFNASNKSTDACYLVNINFTGLNSLNSIEASINQPQIEIGGTAQISYTLYSYIGDVIPNEQAQITYKSTTPSIATVDSNGVITGISEGTAKINVTAVRGGAAIVKEVEVFVEDTSELLSIEIESPGEVWTDGTKQLTTYANMASGNRIPIPTDKVSYEIVAATPADAASIDENDKITGGTAGSVTVVAKSGFKDKDSTSPELVIPIVYSGDVDPAITTMAEREIIRENIDKYGWASKDAEAVIKEADTYVDNVDEIYDLIVGENLPRYYHVGHKYDPDKFTCRYCGCDIGSKYGSYAWIVDPLNNPWKIQCPDCRRYFPSNDFGGFYELGLDEHGFFQYEQAKAKNAELVANGEDGYLKNLLYPEKGEGWGVDDGFGYKPGTVDINGNEVKHTYVAYYLHEGLWHNKALVLNAVRSLANAYVYTDNIKYGRAGVILLDRVADFYPTFEWSRWKTFRGDNYQGKILDVVWECGTSQTWCEAYDSLLPAYSDEQAVAYLSEKSKKYNQENSKTSPMKLRQNVEDNLLREVIKAAVNSDIAGNFGMTQNSVATAAIALNTMPETGEWLEWLMLPGEPYTYPRPGGKINYQLVTNVDRDGNGNEAAPGYNALWVNNLIEVADLLAGYADKYPAANLYENPKFAKMFTAQAPLVLGGHYTAQIGDSGSAAGTSLTVAGRATLISGFRELKDDTMAQLLYRGNGNSASGLHYPMTVEDPGRLEEEVQEVIDRIGPYSPDSDMLAGYGFAVLRDGANYALDSYTEHDTIRDFALYFGRNTGHGHYDTLNLFVSAYGINMAPELGYPEQTGTQPNRMQWVDSTLSHNTVMVNGQNPSSIMHGTPLHFDNSGRVQVMDIDATNAYPNTDMYRRTLVMVEVDDERSYGVDFFRINGGEDHIYSFHSQSDEIYETEGLEFVAQVDEETGEYVGSYAGADVPWGQDPNTNVNSSATSYLAYPPGFTWLYNVRRDDAPEKNLAVDFAIKDFYDVTKKEDLHLRLTMVNPFELTELAITTGNPPFGNPAPFEYMLARRTAEPGEQLDSLYTTVYEPYQKDRYLEKIEPAELTVLEEGTLSDSTAHAVKVTHTTGRVDYIVYANDNSVLYRVDDTFNFRGVIGVYSIKDGLEVYSYVNDGDVIGDNTGLTSEYTGEVVDFTRELQMENTITVNFDQQIDAESLAGKWMHIETDGTENGAYKILGATQTADGIVLDIGDVTLIRAYMDKNDPEKGWLYNISGGAKFRIPLATMNDTRPIFDAVPKKSVEAGSELKFQINAESPNGLDITYSAGSLPRGAQFDPATQTFSWIPDGAQLGANHVSFIASDGILDSTLHVEIEVHNATGGDSPSAGVTTPGSMGPGSTTTPDDGKTDEENPDDSGNTGDTDDKTKRFIDLGNHKWAEDAIYRLVDLGVINGTSENTYSPGNAITRADFTTLIVRAFDFTAETTENFPDVESGKYYTDTIAIAKALGIVNGDSKGNFNPMASITRQDMMVIIARAASVAGIDLSGDVENSFPDMDKVSDYAKDAVELLISSGIIAGSNGVINPLGTTTRAEVAVVLDRLVLFGK